MHLSGLQPFAAHIALGQRMLAIATNRDDAIGLIDLEHDSAPVTADPAERIRRTTSLTRSASHALLQQDDAIGQLRYREGVLGEPVLRDIVRRFKTDRRAAYPLRMLWS